MTNPVPFTNDIGQIINVGDKVLAVTVSSHTVKTREGIYVGQSSSGSPQVRRTLQIWGAYYEGTNQRASWPHQGEVEYKYVPHEGIGTMYNGRVYALREEK